MHAGAPIRAHARRAHRDSSPAADARHHLHPDTPARRRRRRIELETGVLEHVANYPVIRKLGGRNLRSFPLPGPVSRPRGRSQAHISRVAARPLPGGLPGSFSLPRPRSPGKLDHPHIAQIYDAGVGEDAGYIVMEYVPGRDDRALLHSRHPPAGRADGGDRLQVRARPRLCAHAGASRTATSSSGNLLYAAAPTDVRISDFGLAPTSAPRPPRSPAWARRPTCRPSRSAKSSSITAPTSTRSAW